MLIIQKRADAKSIQLHFI